MADPVTGPNVPKRNYKYKDVQHLLEGESQDFTGKVLPDSLSLCLSFSLSAVFPCGERGCSASTVLSSVNKVSSFCREEEKERLTTMGYYWPS